MTSSPRVAVFLVAAMVATSMAAASDGEAPQCDMATKSCPEWTGPPPMLQGMPLLRSESADEPPHAPCTARETLRRHLDAPTYAALAPFLPCEVPPTTPLPPRPRSIGAQGGFDQNASAHAGPIIVEQRANGSWNASFDLASGAGNETAGQVPCRDPRGCPDLVVDASRLLVGTIVDRAFAATDCSVDEGSAQAGNRRLLRFTFTTPNFGDGDLWVGTPGNHPDWFTWATCHQHYHFNQHADYRLWTPEDYVRWRQVREANRDALTADVLAAHPELAASMLAGHKQGFCVEDVQVYAPMEPAKYLSCADNQGISRGWGDEYQFQLDGQWIDITDLPAGLYILEGEVNPQHAYRESDYWNNSGAAAVLIPPPHAPVGPYGLPGGL